jgi:hypothetical protein
MNVGRMTKKMWKEYARQWAVAGPALEAVRRKSLVRCKYDADDADTILAVADSFGESRSESGLVEMQRLFLKCMKKRKHKGQISLK